MAAGDVVPTQLTYTGMKVNKYDDLVSHDELLIPAFHPPMKLAFNGMMYAVESKMIPPVSIENGSKVIDLVELYGLVEVDSINSVGALDEYMDRYTDRLIYHMKMAEEFLMSRGMRVDKKVDVGLLKSNMEGVMDQIRSRFSDFRFYTGLGSTGTRLAYTCPGGSLVFADTRNSGPPTFYYLVYGMRGIHNYNLEEYLLSHPSLLYSSEEEGEKKKRLEEQKVEKEVTEEDLALKRRLDAPTTYPSKRLNLPAVAATT